jgi:cyclic pyranopterin phosphate synthase
VHRSSVGQPSPGPPGPSLSHVDEEGAARMVDVSDKPVTAREAVARGRIEIAPAAMRLVRAGKLKKGGVVEVARLAGILAAKRTSEAIPLCHPLPLTHVDVDLVARRDGFLIEARVRTEAKTGAEMEALHAVAVAALTVYDMVKAADRAMRIGEIRLVRKTGGRSGSHPRDPLMRGPEGSGCRRLRAEESSLATGRRTSLGNGKRASRVPRASRRHHEHGMRAGTRSSTARRG